MPKNFYMKKASKRPDLLIIGFVPETIVLERAIKLKNILNLSLLKKSHKARKC